MKKTKMINQLTLGVGLKDEATFENFFPGKNSQLLEVLKNANERVVYFYGIGGEGCTHLLQACCHAAQHHNSAPSGRRRSAAARRAAPSR